MILNYNVIQEEVLILISKIIIIKLKIKRGEMHREKKFKSKTLLLVYIKINNLHIRSTKYKKPKIRRYVEEYNSEEITQ